MIIGLPQETKTNESRVALIPTDVEQLINAGHSVHVTSNAGTYAGYTDAEYKTAGAEIMADNAATYAKAKLIVKVKEPTADDLPHLKPHHTLFCYLHLAASEELTKKLCDIGLTAYAFETVTADGTTPLLAPMSAIAGRLATQIGTWFLHAPRGGRGVLMGGISGLPAGRVTVVGAGIAGTEAATLAHNMGAVVTVLDVNPVALDRLKLHLPHANVQLSTPENIAASLPRTSLLVGAVYVVGKKAPHVITEKHIKLMPKGSIAVDIAIDQGGCMETSEPNTHDNPVTEKHGVLHSAITNLPAAAPHTASEILSRAITPYVQDLAVGKTSAALHSGLNIAAGELKISL